MSGVTDKDREAARGCYDGPGDTGLLNITLAIATARAEGYRAGLEAAAKECDKRAWLNDRPEPRDPEQEAMALEPRACAAAIRALAKEGER